MTTPIISVSGLRGIVGQNLDPILVTRFVCSFAGQIDPGPIVVTRDGRATGSMLASAVCGALSAVGRDVLYADVAATPTTGILVRQYQAAGGIQISASHNPAEYNGIKLFGREGRVINAVAGERVIKAYEANQFDWVSHDQIGRIDPVVDTTSEHLRLVLATVDADRIRKRKFKVVLDSNHGAGSVLARTLFEHLGVDATLMGDKPDGLFDHPPEPTAANLAGVAKTAVDLGADVVFCQDPDADRLAIIDELGNYIGEEYTLAITLNHRLAKQPGIVVINCATSRMSMDIALRHKSTCLTSAVGEANVTDMMIEKGAVYGGEGNGGPIDPRVGFVRDSFVAMAQVLDCMAESGKTISQMVNDLPTYSICKTTIQIERQRIPELLAALESAHDDANANHQDGLRLDWPDQWLLVRPSNTEPIVRAIAEAKDVEAAQKLCQLAADAALQI